MQQEFEKASKMQSNSQDGTAWSNPDWAQMMADDEKMARELQASFDQNNYVDSQSPLQSSSARNSSVVKLPPTPTDTSNLLMADDIDESGDAVAVRDFVDSVNSLRCANCNTRHSVKANNVVSVITLFLKKAADSGHKEIEYYITCSKCRNKTCPGCGDAINSSGVAYGCETRDGVHEKWHCDRGRLALIWVLSCGYDNKTSHNKVRVATNPRAKTPGSGPSKSTQERAGTGYGTLERYSGYGHAVYDSGSDYGEPHPWISNPYANQKTKRHGPKEKLSRPNHQDPDDSMTSFVLSLLAAALPSPTGYLVPTQFDFEPPECLRSILKCSSILDKAADLLRSSLDDASNRSGLYQNLFDFICKLESGGSVTSSIFRDGRRINKAGHDLLKVSFSSPTRMREEGNEEAEPLIQTMQDMASQSDKMLRIMQTSGKASETEDMQEMFILCTFISDCAHAIRVSQSMSAQALDGSSQEPDRVWKKRLAILPIDDEVILQHHYYGNEARKLINVTNPPKNRLSKIWKEIVALETSLPDGVYVRYGEGRPDVMKVVIVGPKDTPYENGMFEFDIFCPLEYPNKSPKMWLKTTGGGSVGFNPNLYADGKVCLSLLGTWQGSADEEWNPKESTLLQVVVSVQAMIFIDEPYINEPGRNSMHGTHSSKQYNRQLYPDVVKYAMIEWIENNRSKDLGARKRGGGRKLGGSGDISTYGQGEDIWAEVAKKHFETSAEDIIKTVSKWVNDRPSGSSGSTTSKQPKSMGMEAVLPFYSVPTQSQMASGHLYESGPGLPHPPAALSGFYANNGPQFPFSSSNFAQQTPAPSVSPYGSSHAQPKFKPFGPSHGNGHAPTAPPSSGFAHGNSQAPTATPLSSLGYGTSHPPSAFPSGGYGHAQWPVHGYGQAPGYPVPFQGAGHTLGGGQQLTPGGYSVTPHPTNPGLNMANINMPAYPGHAPTAPTTSNTASHKSSKATGTRRGRTLGGNEEQSKPAKVSKFEPSDLQQYPDLASKLKEVVKLLQANSTRRGHVQWFEEDDEFDEYSGEEYLDEE